MAIKVTVGLGKTLSPGISRRLPCHHFFLGGGGVTVRSQALGDVTIVFLFFLEGGKLGS